MKKLLEPVIHSLIWITGFIIVALTIKTIGVFHKNEGSFLIPLLSGTVINLTIFYGIALFLIPRFSVKRKSSVFIAETIGLLLILTLTETLLDYFFFTSLFSSAEESFKSQGIINLALNLMFACAALAYGFVKNWIRNERARQKLKEEKLQAELNFLKSQVNPHFLFNVLNTAFSSAIQSGDGKTANIIEKLSGLMRYMLYDSNVDRVDLAREIDYLKDYIELQKLRISPEIPVEIVMEIQGDSTGLMIAPLILVPFIENAFKHGIKFDQPSFIRILMACNPGMLTFRAENSRFRELRGTRSGESGIGLDNVRKRLNMIYPGKHLITIREAENVFLVELELTLK
jgi:sensor histidine kinase YesM